MGLTLETIKKVFDNFAPGNRGYTRMPECISKCPFIVSAQAKCPGVAQVA